MNSNEFDDYIKDVLNHVSFVFEHKSIKRELMSHLIDLQDEYGEQGIEESECIKRVLEDMGDPVEVGKGLNQIHHPIIGWLWMMSRIAVFVLVAYSLFLMSSEILNHLLSNRFVSDNGFNIEQFMQDKVTSTNTRYMDRDLNIEIELNDGVLLIDRFIQSEDGTVFILYQEKHNLILFDLNKRVFDLRQYAQLIFDDQKFNAESDGLFKVNQWNVLIFRKTPLEYSRLELKYKQVSEMFEKVLR